MIKIFRPIFVKPTYAYLSLSDYYLGREKGKEVEVEVYNGEKLVGKSIINKEKWIRTCKFKESVVKLRPEEPMIFYYNFLRFNQPKTAEKKVV